MEIWIFIAGLTLLVLAAISVPLWRPGHSKPDDSAYDATVYRDQLAELDRDLARGVIDERQAEQARNEIARRLLAVERKKRNQADLPAGQANRAVLVAGLVLVPAVAIALYLRIGNPHMADQPREQRLAAGIERGDVNAMVIVVEKALRKNPGDIRGWKVIAPVYMRMRRFDDAARAWARVLDLQSSHDTETLLNYVESKILAAKGRADEQTRRALKEALARDKDNKKARFYQAVILQSEGRRDAALSVLRKLLADSDGDINLQMIIQQRIAALSGDAGKGPALDREQRQAAAQMTPARRQQMITGMVNRLDNRLKENGDDLDGWLKLLRARMVLGQKEKAVKALAAARKNFSGNTAALKRLDEAAERLGLKN